MIQIYKPGNTEFDQNGDMTLFPTEATVHPVLNGEWEVNLAHPIDDEGRWKYIEEDAVLKMPSFNGEQLFRIKKKEKTDTEVTAEAQPIFMDAKDDCFLLDVRPTEKTGQQALDIMTAPNKKYSASSNIDLVSTAYYQTQNLIEAINGEDENAFVNRWGGEVLYDNFTVIVNDRVGGDHGMEILYGKNIPEDGFSEEIDMRDVVTRIIPKAFNGHMIDGDEPWIDSPVIDKYPTIRYGVMEFEDVKMREDSQDGDEEDGIVICDTQEELKEALTKRCEEQFEAGLDKPKVTISADLVILENTDLYKDIKELTEVSLGDTVHCRHTRLDITTDARVIELEWDCIQKKVNSVSLGDFQYNYIDDATSMINRAESAIRPDGSVIGQQIQGIMDGVKAQLRAQSSVAKKSKVRAVLFEDLDPESPTFGAMCLGTQGFEIASKRTADGRDWDWSTFGTGQGFFADFIVAGTMLADRIRGGVLELGGLDNTAGIMRLIDENGDELMGLSNEGMRFSYPDGSKFFVRCFNMGGAKLFVYPEQSGDLSHYFTMDKDRAGIQHKEVSVVAEGAMTIGAGSMTVMRNGQGSASKTGRAQFSDGTYLEFVNGFLVGGNTKGGAF